jgi:DNA-binding transcriptional LysR family regulator
VGVSGPGPAGTASIDEGGLSKIEGSVVNQLNTIRAFCKVAESCSFARAAEVLDLPVSRVSRLVYELESRLGTRLLNRTTRQTSLTESGRLYLERCSQILDDIEEAEAAVAEHVLSASGQLRLVAPTLFALRKLPPVLVQFQQQHPRVEIELIVADRSVDLVSESFDLGILPSRRVTGVSVVSRHLTETDRFLCASPEYIAQKGAPTHPSQLSDHVYLASHTEYGDDQLTFHCPDGTKIPLNPNRYFSSNNIGVIREGVRSGMGIAAIPAYLVDDDVQAGRLLRLMPEYRLPDREFRLVYASRKFVSLKVRSFIELALAHFQPDAH